ncbi:probable G-protein coupled receptor 139 [Narcine bancroftii]|uniref:probable G-protein coupled receptor 139 n=1 Tax=Narcine bancroftii TaxID=1343680 RepID=UPI003831628D
MVGLLMGEVSGGGSSGKHVPPEGRWSTKLRAHLLDSRSSGFLKLGLKGSVGPPGLLGTQGDRGPPGQPVNLIAIVILSRGKCGLSKCITRYLVGMAGADLIGVVFGVVMDQVNNIYVYVASLLRTPICATVHVLRIATMDCSVWLTVAFTFDRWIAICSQKLRERFCTARTATVVTVTVGICCCARCLPYYFAVEPYSIINHVPWRCVLKAEYFTDSFWKGYQLFNSIVTPLLPIGLMVLFNALTVSRILAANRARREFQKDRGNQRDTEVENRKKSMILLFALSANFILLWIPFVAYTTRWQVQNYSYTDRYLNTPPYILQQFGFMLQFFCTCTNSCIYTLSQRKFREELKNGGKSLSTLCGQLCNKMHI